MNLKDYFSSHRGSGTLATADIAGNVDLAVYARPHVRDDSTISFIMRDRLSHRNLQSNPHAAYMFLEDGSPSQGTRLYLTRIDEETNPELIRTMRRRTKPDAHPEEEKFLVTFHVDRILPAVIKADKPN